ncbi:ABC transporter permease [Salinispira pacifica]
MKLRAGMGRKVVLAAVGLYLFVLLLCAVAAPVVAPYDPLAQNQNSRFLPPLSAGHLLGTDDFGRDVLSRVIWGVRPALLVGVISVGIALLLGLIFGLGAGLSGTFSDNVIMLIADSILSFPTVLLAITVVAVLGYGVAQVMLAVGVIFSPVFARIVRAETLALKEQTYVLASRALGSSLFRTVATHILPNMLPRLLVQASVTFALAIVIEASLSFLGLGTQPPNASWGLMLKDARSYLLQAPWLAIYPGIALGVTVFCFNFIGDTVAERYGLRGR